MRTRPSNAQRCQEPIFTVRSIECFCWAVRVRFVLSHRNLCDNVASIVSTVISVTSSWLLYLCSNRFLIYLFQLNRCKTFTSTQSCKHLPSPSRHSEWTELVRQRFECSAVFICLPGQDEVNRRPLLVSGAGIAIQRGIGKQFLCESSKI